MKSYWQRKHWIDLPCRWWAKVNFGYHLFRWGLGFIVDGGKDGWPRVWTFGVYLRLGPMFFDIDIYGPDEVRDGMD